MLYTAIQVYTIRCVKLARSVYAAVVESSLFLAAVLVESLAVSQRQNMHCFSPIARAPGSSVQNVQHMTVSKYRCGLQSLAYTGPRRSVKLRLAGLRPLVRLAAYKQELGGRVRLSDLL